MTANEYLSQVYCLDRKIKYDLKELEALREMSCGISSPNLGERVSGSKSTEAPFVRALERVWEQEARINAEIKQLEETKEQIRRTIEAVGNYDERCLLLYRYIQHMKWEDICLELHISISTAKRWHQSALRKIRVPQ